MTKRAATWKRVKFGDVVRLNKETCKDPASAGIVRAIGLEHLEPGELRVRSWGDVAAGTTFTNRVRTGQVLFGKRRAYQRKVAVVDFDAVCSSDIYSFESVNPLELLPGLLPFICQTDSFFERAVGTSAGSLSPRTNWTSLAEYEFALPPLEKQQRAAACLMGIDRLCETLRDASARAKDVRDRLRLEMAEGSTRWRRLDTFISFLTSGSRGWSKHYAIEGQAFLRISNLNSPTIELNRDEIQRIRAPDDAEAERTQVRGNDVLLGITGEAGVGLVGIVRDYEHPTFVSQHVALIRLDTSQCSPDYIAHVLAGGLGQRQIARYNQAGTKGGMTLVAVRDLLIPDLPLDVQQQWTERISRAEQAMQGLADRSTATLELKRQALSALFSSESEVVS